MDNIYDYIIIGAGISGIAYAYKNKTDKFLILEKNDYIGGRIKNIKWNDNFISLGGGVFLPSHKICRRCAAEKVRLADHVRLHPPASHVSHPAHPG